MTWCKHINTPMDPLNKIETKKDSTSVDKGV